MTKGTTSFGLRGRHTHTICNRCNHRAYHKQHKRCGSCGYPDAKMRRFNWSEKAKRRRTVGTGRCRYLKNAIRRAKNGFRDGKTPKAAAKPTTTN